jgi:hypothetical protein
VCKQCMAGFAFEFNSQSNTNYPHRLKTPLYWLHHLVL